MPLEQRAFEALLAEKFPDAAIHVRDLAGDGDHYEVEIVSAVFRGLSRVAQQRRVFDLLKDTPAGSLHAMALKTRPPETKGD